MIKKLGRIVFVVLVAVGVAVGATVAWAMTDAGSSAVLDNMARQIKERTGLVVSFGAPEVDFFPPRIRLTDLKAKDMKGRIDCAVGEVELSPDVIDLLQRELSIEVIYLGAPNCRVTLDRADLDTLFDPAQPAKKAGAPAWDLSAVPTFDVVAVSQGELTLIVDDPEQSGQLQLEVQGLGLDVTGDASGIEIRGMIAGATGKWRQGNRRVDESLQSLRFRVGVHSDSLAIRYAEARVAGGEFRLREATIAEPEGLTDIQVADLMVNLPLDVFNRLPLDLPTMVGTAGYEGSLGVNTGSDGELGLFAEGEVKLNQTSVDEFVIGDLIGRFALTPDRVTFDKTTLSTAQGQLKLKGKIDLDKQLTTQITANLDRIELAHLLEQVVLDGAQVTQDMSGQLAFRGRLNPLRLEGTARLDVDDHTVLTDGFRVKNKDTVLFIPRAKVDGHLVITDHHLGGHDLTVQLDNTTLGVNMRFDFPNESWWLEARSRDFHLDDLKQIAGFDVRGRGPLTCRISGPLNDPKIVGTAVMENFVFSEFSLGRAATEVRFYDLALSFNGLEVNNRGSRYSLSELLLDFSAPSGLDISTKIEAEKVALTELARIFRIDTKPFGSPTGNVIGRVAIDYSIEPERLRVEADLVHDDLVLFDERFGPDVIRVVWDDDALTINELGLTKGKGTISITGSMDKDQSLNMIGVASGVNLNAFDNPLMKKLDLRAKGQVFAVVEGSLDHPQGWADVRLGRIRHHGITYGPSTLKLTLDNRAVHGRGKLAGKLIDLEHLTVDIARDRLELEGFFKDIDLARVFDYKLQDHQTSLLVTGEAALAGRLTSARGLSGHAVASEVKVRAGDFSFANRAPVRVNADRDRFRITPVQFSGKDVVFNFGGSLGFDKLDLRIEGLADLKLAGDLAPQIRKSAGKLDFRARARGSWDNPSFLGRAEVTEGRVRLHGFAHPIENIQGKVVMDPKAIEFVDFTARTASGNLGLKGEMSFAKGAFTDYEFTLHARDLELAPLDNLSFKASTGNSGLVLRSPPPGELPKIIGDVEIRNSRYTQDFRVLQMSDLTVDRLLGTQTTTSKPRLFDKEKDDFAFDIRLHGNRNLKARNNIIDVDVVIDDRDKPLRLVGTNQSIGFLGQILGKGGQVRFAGKRFDVDYATVEFTDPLKPDNPRFRVTANSQVRDYKIILTAEGTVEEYKLKFASQPYLSDEDIVFLVLTGLTKTEHGQFNTGGMSLGTPILGQLGPSGEAIPLELQVYNEYSEKAGTDTTRVALGQWVTRDVWVSVSSSIGQERDVEANLDYKINDSVSVSAGYENDNESQLGNVGVDLKFRLEF